MKRNPSTFRYFILAIFTTLSTFAHGNVPVVYSDSSKFMRLTHDIYTLTDSSSKLTIEEVAKQSNFKKSAIEVPNFGVSKNAFWIKFDLKNATKTEKLLLQLSYPLLDQADLYTLDLNGGYTVIKAGDCLPYSARKYLNQNFIYDLEIRSGDTKTYYMKIRSNELILVPLLVSTREPLVLTNATTDVFMGLYIGIILVMFLYNSFIYLTTKDKDYFYYIIYILFIGLTQVTLLGYSNRLLWPDNEWLTSHGLFIAAALGSSAIALFMKDFLNMKKYTPKLIPGVYVIVGIYIMVLIATLLDKLQLAYQLTDLNGLLITIFSMVVATIISLKGYKPARYFLLGWSMFLMGVSIFVLRSYGVLPYNNFTSYTMPIGSAVEVVLLSLALADRINILKREKEESQILAINALKENEQLITNQNFLLEQKVARRTHELETAYQELKDAQTQLVSSEKMASLGQLTAGIAHEINNPINFVVSSIAPLKRDIADIKELLDRYEKLTPKSDLEPELKEISKLRKEIDIDFVKDEIDQLLRGINDGATRTAEIVKSLKTFSRVDESDLKRADLNEGLASTIVLLTQQWSGVIDLVRNFGTISHIECYPGKLNQVFMNILNNAIQAILSHPNPNEKGRIEVSTFEEEGHIVISIKDNGMGMTPETKKKIFEPFFTTKEVGKGTGLGLSITYSIIEKHGGTVEVLSEVGQGAEFILRLPVVDEFVVRQSETH